MRTLFFLQLLLLSSLAIAQGSDQGEPRKFGIQFKGFVKSDYWYDSRQVVGAREDIILLLPTNRLQDANGKDINAHPTFNYSPVSSRITGVITGPDAFGAKTSGMIEADFSGVTNADINGFRLRHAIGKLRWTNSELMFGQYWHPMFVPEVFPAVISLNTGAPFQPFIRNPLISYTQFFNRFNLNFTLLSQRDNANDGPLGASSIYIRNTLIPNAHLQLQYKHDKYIWGIAADYKVLKPRLATANNYKTNETISTYAFMGYFKYTNRDFLWSCKTIYGQNLTEHLLLGGYAVRSVDLLTKYETYTPTNHLFFWNFIGYGKTLKVCLYTGFAKNLGTTHNNTGTYYSRGKDIDYAYRIAPSLSWVSGKVQVSSELEYTAAAYGTPDNKGNVKNADEFGNLRLLLTFFYFF
ncbi:MAG: hypothetical protein U1C46_05140 [Bacteroidales bacterium]|nr:hypothetical protein [Bacteroidales bacterium]MDZ4204185.1 hypothetical protein [Bacteroidales bacterium]